MHESREARNAIDGAVQIIIVGAGNRSMNYASFAQRYPKQMQVVGVVDPDPQRRGNAASLYQISQDMCFMNVEELASKPKMADAVINGTLDSLHVKTSLPLLRKGYDLLLEKPIGISEQEVLELYDAAQMNNSKVMICHVLRYAPFYVELQKVIEEGIIGEIIHIQTEENVDYHHMATAFVRGKFANMERGGSSFLMQKCCHDLDLITWFKSGIRPVKVSSFGNRSQFRAERAPEGAGTRCLTDCLIEEHCIYSAKKLYVDQPLWGAYVWPRYLDGIRLNSEEKLESLAADNPFGRCVWRCDNDIVDHQAVIFEFEDGSTAVHNLVGATSKACRTVHITGTKGEIQGLMEDGVFVIRHPDATQGHTHYTEKRVEINVSSDMHGGGDHRLVEDFLRVVKGESSSRFSTSLENSIIGHLVGFSADASIRSGQSIKMDWNKIK